MSVGPLKSFVMVDVPGLIEGAAEGAGLGIRFLKHLSRTRLLLHMVDVLPPDESPLVTSIRTIQDELRAFSAEVSGREKWLVFNKIDLLPAEESERLIADTLRELGWTGRWFAISAATRAGCDVLCAEAMQWIDAQAPRQHESDDQEPSDA